VSSCPLVLPPQCIDTIVWRPIGDPGGGGAGQEKPDDIRVAYQGPTLWEAILQLAPQTPKRPPKKPFRMSVIKMWNTTLAPGVYSLPLLQTIITITGLCLCTISRRCVVGLWWEAVSCAAK
jgi:hypothetical protein